MAGFQTANTGTITVQRGRPQTPVVDIRLCRPAAVPPKASLVGASAYRRTNDLTMAQVKRMREMRQRGVSTREIAKAIGCARSTAKHYVKGIAAPPEGWSTGGHKSRLCRVQIAELRREGLTYRQIGERLGASETGVYNALNTRKPRYGQALKSPITRMVKAVSGATQISASDLFRPLIPQRGGRPPAAIGRARQILFWLIRNYLTERSYPKMALALGGFDHSTCIHGVRRVEALVVHHRLKRRLRPFDMAKALWAMDWARTA